MESTCLCIRCNLANAFPVMETRIKFSFRIQHTSEKAADDMKKAIEKALTRPEPLIFQPMPLMGLCRQVIRQTMNNGRFGLTPLFGDRRGFMPPQLKTNNGRFH